MTQTGAESRRPLSGQVALVTGAGKRLGRAIALHLAGEGAKVVVHYRQSHAAAMQVVQEIEKNDGEAVAIRADLTRFGEVHHLFAEAITRFRRLDILVNSAANFLSNKFGTTTERDWDLSLDSNLKAPFFCIQAAAPDLRKSRGVVINFSDLGGIVGWTGFIPHCLSKSGIIMLTRILAKELAPEIRVNAIAPGTITMPGDPPEWESEFIARAPLGRTGKPADITAAVSFLIQSTMVTGQTIVLDAGRTL